MSVGSHPNNPSASIEVYAGGALVEKQETTKRRIVVYGSQLSGAFSLTRAIRGYFEDKGVENVIPHLTRNALYIDDVFYGRGSDLPEVEEGIPDGVIVFPEMRYYDNTGGTTVRTPIEHILKLCLQNGVPMARFSDSATSEEIVQGMASLAYGSSYEQAGLPPA